MITRLAVLALIAMSSPPLSAAQSSTAKVVLRIGVDAPSRDYEFQYIRDVEVSPNGDIIVLNSADPFVRTYDATGRFIRRIGGKGEGPGEFTGPSALTIRNGELVVWQRAGWKEARFTLAGRLVQSQIVGNTVGTNRRYPVRSGTIIEHSPLRGFNEAPSELWRYVVFERLNPRRLDTLLRIRPDTTFFQREGLDAAMGVPSGFGPSGVWALSGDSVMAYADGYRGTVTWWRFDDRGITQIKTDTLGRVGRPVLPADVRAQERWQQQYGPTKSCSGSMGGPSSCSSGAFRAHFPPSHFSVATDALFSSDGTLWVGDQRALSNREPAVPPFAWKVFPPSGPGFSIQFPSTFTLTAVRGDRAYGYARNADGEYFVVVYEVTRP